MSARRISPWTLVAAAAALALAVFWLAGAAIVWRLAPPAPPHGAAQMVGRAAVGLLVQVMPRAPALVLAAD